MSRDNQGRYLAGVKEHFDMLADMRKRGMEMSSARFEERVKKHPLPDWTTVEGVLVLRSGDANEVAVPRNGKKTAASFEILTLKPRRLLTFVQRDEVHSWLWRAAQKDL